MQPFRRFWITRLSRAACLSLVGLLMYSATAPSGAQDPQLVNTGSGNVAIRGYDPVAYFTRGEAEKGKPEYSFVWNDVEWHFLNADHRDMFASDPERFAPQFGGFCSMALSNGQIVAADPETWTIVDGKLYLKVSQRGRERFLQNTDEIIKKAEENWAELQGQDQN